MRKPPVPIAEEQPPAPPNFSRMSFLKPPMPDFPEEALSGEMGGGYNKPSHPLIEDEDDFEAIITFPDGDFVRATSTSKEAPWKTHVSAAVTSRFYSMSYP
ncbi:unnamed protein product [Symbiodinium pilosum]|uniref:Uncharacterized protein n=1 Tax=Symbiodinium pilosum TaxID=2952 RepID=A0A812UI77_SYMPI|nr:unnamed protein product [Symbiodinium pilosum]